jgi:hypothetical protein
MRVTYRAIVLWETSFRECDNRHGLDPIPTILAKGISPIAT